VSETASSLSSATLVSNYASWYRTTMHFIRFLLPLFLLATSTFAWHVKWYIPKNSNTRKGPWKTPVTSGTAIGLCERFKSNDNFNVAYLKFDNLGTSPRPNQITVYRGENCNGIAWTGELSSNNHVVKSDCGDKPFRVRSYRVESTRTW
jgi:hypothetical protein